MPKLYILIFIILSSTNYLNAFPLQEIDSLHIRLLIVEDEEKIETLLTLSEAYRNIVFNDCIKYGMQALRLADETNNKTLKALIFKSLGISCYYSGNMDIALGYYSQSLNVYKDIKDEKGQANCLNNIGLPSLNRTNRATMINTGDNAIIANKDNTKSINRFKYFLYIIILI